MYNKNGFKCTEYAIKYDTHSKHHLKKMNMFLEKL